MKHSPTSILLVVVQFGCVVYLMLTGPILPRHPVATPLLVLGGTLGLWALWAMRRSVFRIVPEVHPDARLITDGPYRRIRHPMYTSLILITAAWLIALPAWPRVASTALLLVVLLVKLSLEEVHLRNRFPGYADYAQHTKRLIPFIY